jgi:hypothetical protein
VTVRDPSAVRVEVDRGKGLQVLLPEGASSNEVPLPDTSPPFREGYREKTVVRRLPAGPIVLACAKCDPEEKTLVPLDGTITFGSKFGVQSFDWTQKEMRVHLRDGRDASYGTVSAFDAEVVTPWSNVVQVRRASTPDRYLGLKLLLSAAMGIALGSFALGDGVSNHHATTTTFGAIILPISGVLAIGGGWYALAPTRELILFGH